MLEHFVTPQQNPQNPSSSSSSLLKSKMARKVQAVDILPPPSSSSDDETHEGSSSSSTDDEQHQKPQPQQQQESDDESEDDESEPEPVVNKPALQEAPDSEDSDETRNSPSAFIVKPIVPKPTRVKSRAKRPADPEPSHSVSNNKKTKVEKNGDGHTVVGNLEKGKKVLSESEEKKSVIKWSEKDEIELLAGIIQYKEETGDDVNSKIDASYEYVKGLLSVNLTKNQLFEKIKRLKKKFQTNAGKFKNDGENKVFELSQKIWGSEGSVSKVKSSKKKDGNVVSDTNTNTGTPLKSVTNRELFVQEEVKDTILEEETQDYWLLYPRLCASLESEAASGYLTVIGNIKEHVKEIISGMRKEKARELEDGWKAIHLMDAQLYAKRADLISKQAEAFLDIDHTNLGI